MTSSEGKTLVSSSIVEKFVKGDVRKAITNMETPGDLFPRGSAQVLV